MQHATSNNYTFILPYLLAAVSCGRGRGARLAHLMPLGRYPAGQRPLGFRSERAHELRLSHLWRARAPPPSPVESLRLLREVSPTRRAQRRRWRWWRVRRIAQLVRVARLQRRDCRQGKGAAGACEVALLRARSAGAMSGGGSRWPGRAIGRKRFAGGHSRGQSWEELESANSRCPTTSASPSTPPASSEPVELLAAHRGEAGALHAGRLAPEYSMRLELETPLSAVRWGYKLPPRQPFVAPVLTPPRSRRR